MSKGYVQGVTHIDASDLAFILFQNRFVLQKSGNAMAREHAMCC